MSSPRTYNKILFGLFVGFIVLYIDKLSVGLTLIPLSEQYGFSASQKGFIMSAFYLGYGSMQIPMGILANKIRPKTMLICSLLLLSVFTAVFGSLGLSNSTPLMAFLVVRFLTGFIASAAYPIGAAKTIDLEFPKDKKSAAQGVLLATTGITGVLGPLIIAPLIAKSNWSMVYFLVTILALIVSLLLYVILPTNDNASIPKKETHASNSEGVFKLIVKNPQVWVLFLANIFINYIMAGASNWLPSYFTDSGFSIVSIAPILASSAIFAIAGSIILTRIVAKYIPKKLPLATILCATIGLLPILALFYLHEKILLFILLSIGNFFLAGAFSLIMSIPFQLFKGDYFSPAYGILQTGGVFGAFVAPLIIGKIVQLSDNHYGWMFVSFIITLILLIVSTALVKEEAPS